MPLSIDRRRLMLAGAMAALVPPASSEPVTVADPGGEEFVLWPDGAPGSARVTVREEVVERQPEGPLRDRFARHVTRPKLTLFAPQGEWNGITLLIVPGGGYVRVVIDKEGFESAEWFAARGFAAAVLRYRLPADGWTAGADVPVHDAQRAIRLLRHRGWPTTSPARRIGLVGFSAGGHLSARLITEPSRGYPRVDESDESSGLPDFCVLMYPVIATEGDAAHAGSVEQLRLAGVAPADLARYSPDRNVNSTTPPTMLIHAADDAGVPLENSLMMHRALLARGVRSELHVFDQGGHGFGLRGVTGLTAAAWPMLVQNWALNDVPGR
jgi:acetyl esterase/lipase